MSVKGVTYDLDETIVSTGKLHEEGWREAGKLFNLHITDRMLLEQRGMAGDKAAKMMVSGSKIPAEDLLEKKESYVREHLADVGIYEGFLETSELLEDNGIKVWVCTSALKAFVDKLLMNHPGLQRFRGRVVYRELYKEGKPAADPLLTTAMMMNLKPEQCLYVGDSFSDYSAAKNAKMCFAYFCPMMKKTDERIPTSVPRIHKHSDLLSILGITAGRK